METESINNNDWEKARNHFNEVYNRYLKLRGVPGVNAEAALLITFNPLILRMMGGERSKDLIEEMMAVE